MSNRSTKCYFTCVWHISRYR